jgi:hypothetical protein
MLVTIIGNKGIIRNMAKPHIKANLELQHNITCWIGSLNNIYNCIYIGGFSNINRFKNIIELTMFIGFYQNPINTIRQSSLLDTMVKKLYKLYELLNVLEFGKSDLCFEKSKLFPEK